MSHPNSGRRAATENIAQRTPWRTSVRAFGRRRMLVHVMCNDHRNGVFSGRATALQVKSLDSSNRTRWDIELEHDDFTRGCACSVDGVAKTIRISRSTYTWLHEREWVGNWCWNAYLLPRSEALRLLRNMLASGRWHITDGVGAGVDAVERWQAMLNTQTQQHRKAPT